MDKPVIDELWTSEDTPRKVFVHGKAALDPDCMVVTVEGKKDAVWMYSTGYLNPIGRDIFAAKSPEEARKIRDGFT